MNVEELYEKRKNDPQWNTSYPLSPKDWEKYRVNGQLPFDNEKELSFYIHIPFCVSLCSFCEYTKMRCPNNDIQECYLRTIQSDINKFKELNSKIVLRGFDIGGGTPTSLSDNNFRLLMQIYNLAVANLKVSADYEPSIEGTFGTLTDEKINILAQSNIHRLSLGIQSTNNDVLFSHHRNQISVLEMGEWMEKAWYHGISKINLDLMYGLKGQNAKTINQDLHVIAQLAPQQVTLYELRTNMLGIPVEFTKEELFSQYCMYYEGLIGMGYQANFGQNTFSKTADDKGLSSYLRSRMLDGISYKGFGISSQSMSTDGISYNIGKSNKSIARIVDMKSFSEEFTYLLPKEELVSKYIAISAYYGSFSLNRITELIGFDYAAYCKEQIDFCTSKGFITFEKGRINITKEGFAHYGAVFSLFYPVSLSSLR